MTDAAGGVVVRPDSRGLRRMAGAAARIIAEKPWTVLATLVGLHLIVGALAFDPVPHSGGDNTAYLALARSLLEHHRYLELWDPARPPHTQYPPGFPIILALASLLGIRGWMALKLMMLAFSGLAVGLSYLWMRARTDAPVAAGVGLVLAVAPGLVGETQWVLSDVPFWAATMAALLVLARGREVWATVLAFLALTIRTAGLPLVLAIIAWQALRRRWKHAVVPLAILVAVAALWTLRAPEESTYTSVMWFQNPYAPELGRIGVGGLLTRMLDNGNRYSFQILMRVLAGGVGIIGVAAGGLFVVAAVAGFGRRLVRSIREREEGRAPVGAVELFIALYVGMLLVWPQPWASDRFLFPILPVLLVYAAEGVGILPGRRSRRAVRWAGALAILGLGAAPTLGLWASAADCRADVARAGPLACMTRSERAFLVLAEWSRGRLPEEAVVISRKPRQWYWFSGYPGRVYPYDTDPSKLLEQAREIGAGYVVLDDLGETADAYLMPALLEHRRRYCLLQHMEEGTRTASLLEILPEEWDPEVYGVDPDSERFRLPICALMYDRAGGEGEAGDGGGD